MSSSSVSSDSDQWIPYGERDEWQDVEPLEQDDGPDPVVRIAYPEKCKQNHSHKASFYRRYAERAPVYRGKFKIFFFFFLLIRQHLSKIINNSGSTETI